MSDPQRSDRAVGRAEQQRGGVDLSQAEMLGATLVSGWAGARRGAALPPLWHWAGFPSTAPMEEIGPDGHPKRGRFLPETGLPRRMWAGGALRFHAPIHIGEPLSRRSEITSITRKTGSTGEMVFVAVEHHISGAAGLAVWERHDIVYLGVPERYRPPTPIPAPAAPTVERIEAIDPVRLFRFSAALFNGHRIHYDLGYATEVENYPGLVTHGPLQAMLIMDLASAWAGRPPSAFRYRGVHPMFHFHDLRLLGVAARTEDGAPSMSLCTAHPEESHQGMQATAIWRPA